MLGFASLGDIPIGALPKQKYDLLLVTAIAVGDAYVEAVYSSQGASAFSQGSSYASAVSYVFRNDVETVFAPCEDNSLFVEKELRELSLPPKQGCC